MSRYKLIIKPFIFTALRAIFAVLILITTSPLINIQASSVSIPTLILLIISGLLGPGVGDAYYAKAIQSIGGSLAVPISYTYILISQLISIMFLGESLRPSLIVGIISVFSGLIVATTTRKLSNTANIKGIAYSLIAAFSWSLGAILIKLVLSHADVFTVTMYRLISVSVVFTSLGLILETPLDRTTIKPLILISALTGTLGFGVGVYLFVYSINTLGVSATTMATALTPVLSQIFIKLLSREEIEIENFLGALLISCGIIISAL